MPRAHPEQQQAGFVLVQARDAAYASPWSYWFDYLTPQQALMDEVSSAPLNLNVSPFYSALSARTLTPNL